MFRLGCKEILLKPAWRSERLESHPKWLARSKVDQHSLPIPKYDIMWIYIIMG